MTNPYRALCANLTAALNDWQWSTGDDRYEGLIDRARALLAEPEAEGQVLATSLNCSIATWAKDLKLGLRTRLRKP